MNHPEQDNTDDQTLGEKLTLVLPYLNERQQRLLLAAEARSLGHGGISRVSRVTGVSRPTIHRGLQELDAETEDVSRIRQPGGGRKLIEQVHPGILEARL